MTTLSGIITPSNIVTNTSTSTLTNKTLTAPVITSVDINSGAIDGVTLGTNSAVTEAQVDNININGNAITSTDTNGNITITPDGTGEVDISKVDIDGGAIDGTAIGANSTSTGVFSSLETEGAFTEDAEAITSSSGTATLDLSAATNFTHTLTENVTYTFSNPATSGKASAFTLKVVQDSTDRTITWPASVDWAGGTAPTISTGSGATDYYVFITTDGGTNYYGFTAGQALATPA